MTSRTDGELVDASTTHGALRGAWHGEIARFAGIPFAAPPVGPLRFRPPQPVEPWDDVRAADTFGPIAPQNPSIMDALFGGDSEQWDEDCLYLNVWTPSLEGSLPVMVWIHGGGFEMGSGSSPLYDGTSFARDGVVLVTLNYRLGAFGFLELGDLDPELAGSGNCGLLDQVAALEWVRDNIASFGGDPDQVTIFGESAGAMSVSSLLAMPSASGLFHRSIAQSGAAQACRTPAQADADTREFLDKMGLDGANAVAALRDAEPAALLAAHGAMAAERVGDPEGVIARTGSPLSFLAFRPVADGRAVPTDPLGRVAEGSAAGVDLLIGTNSEEWKLFALAAPALPDDEALRRRTALLVADADGALEAYRHEADEPTIQSLECAILTDAVFRIPAIRLAEAQAPHGTVFGYLWTWASPALGGMIGASHAIEIPFVFDLVEDQRLHVFVGAEAPTELSRATHHAWVEFARSGVPAAPSLPTWPAYDTGERATMVLDVEPSVALDPGATSRKFWETPGADFPR
ncbi:MAG: carboxylesterase/lipase family protein [Actinomycetota bacterium]|nr:carboxylesterase/lipase family protein [Actinomycetota bacterium]